MRVLTENDKPMTVIMRARIFHRRTLPRGTVHRKKKLLVSVRLGQIRFGFFSSSYGELYHGEKSWSR